MSAVPYSAFLKGVGVACIVLGLVEIGLGSEVWAFSPGNKYGCWWGAMVCVLSGIIALVANNKNTVVLLNWVSAAAAVLLFSGMLVDSLAFRRVNALQTCVNSDTGEVFGASGYEPQAAVCAANTNHLCGCVGHVNDFACHVYDINKYRQQNCELILTRYTDLLLISAIFDTFCLAWVFVLSVISCTSYAAIVASENPQSAPASVPKAAAYSPAKTSEVELKAPAPSAEVVKAADETPDNTV